MQLFVTVEFVQRAPPGAAQQRGDELLADVGKFVADEGRPPGVPREQRLAEPWIGLQQGQYQVERPFRQHGVLLDWCQLGTGDPD